MDHSTVEGGETEVVLLNGAALLWGEGNLTWNPQFDGGEDYHLKAISPCIDAGDNASPGLPATDLDGNPRVVDGRDDGAAVVDMGAYEFQPAPAWGAASTVARDVPHACGLRHARGAGFLMCLQVPAGALILLRRGRPRRRESRPEGVPSP